MPNVKIRKVGAVTIIDFDGRLVIGTGDLQLREAVREALDGGASRVLLNMAGVSMVDSSGIGELVSSYTTTTSRGGKLGLFGLTGKVRDILMLTQLITVFETFDSEQEAVAAFS